MRVHGEHGAEQESLPRKLRHFVQPAAQNEDQQIAGLDEKVEGRTALPGKRARVVKGILRQFCSRPFSLQYCSSGFGLGWIF
jgi:hypothetical protein